MTNITLVNQIQITQPTIAHILKEYQIDEFTYDEIKEGVGNTSLFIKTNTNEYVLRIYLRLKKSNQSIEQEIELQEYLYANQLPIPEIISNVHKSKLTCLDIDGLTWQCLLMRYMGKTDFKSYTPALISELAKIQAKMHLLGISFADMQKNHEPILTELKTTITDRYSIKDINDSHILDFCRRAEEFSLPLGPDLPYGYNHLDYDAYGNVLVKNNKVIAILDFDDVTYSPTIVCLGNTLWHVLFESNNFEIVTQYIHEYQKVKPLVREEALLIPQVMQFRNYEVGLIELAVRKRMQYVHRILNLEKVIKTLRFSGI